MPGSDLEGLRRAGAAARAAGQSYFDNPVFFASVPTDTSEQLLEWHDLCCAWAGGWLQEDDGRDQSLARMLNLRSW